ncbi:polysaccharide pyruvyl transferase family protein [Vibrio cyclitrophicus]|uniref:polysaccharide pyruvyl transferase family protein n=1 Tax=Vibrio cyclitrophicus TaxID=47951 RepID=UPI000C866668|nr:polysaccharide pyruvyl transferase family protein [Vibrio cyclitrophicus]PMJ46414.1 hypothetical protein BCU22_21965 [Vibrio cyclitrophicus]
MNIEIAGIGAPNKGAELMLVAVMDVLQEKYPNARFVLEPYTDYKFRYKHGCYQKSWFTFKDIQVGNLLTFLPKKIRERFGIILDSEIDIILDASGFAYGDQWGERKAKTRLSKYLSHWKGKGKKVIMLPQALGPFTSQALKVEMENIFKHCDIAFARDDMSFEYSNGLKVGNIHQAPDFTNICKGYLPRDLVNHELDICFIPNAKMLSMTVSHVSDNYINSLVDAIKQTQKIGRKPFLLVHEGIGDYEIAKAINEELEDKIEIFQYEDPKEIKGIIGKSNLVISSRFHGVVSSLSQGVPCIATGWSHKYQMLMNDYGCGNYLVDNKSTLVDLVIELTTDEKFKVCKEIIDENSVIQKSLTNEMWKKVFNIIDK